MKRALSGIQPSGKLHIGNYFGAIQKFIELQNNYDSFYFIANYHALTSSPNPEDLRKNSHDILIDYLALGLDPEKSTIFLQSDIAYVTELTWILSNVTPIALLERAHSYKDKVAKGIAPNHGLFSYPVLMAADILLYSSDIVPVGKDQKQHLEITRDIAIKFNAIYGDLLSIPEPLIQENLASIPGTDGQKMSKSYNNTIDIFGTTKEIKKQVMSIVTDSKTLEEPKDPDTCNVFALYKLFVSENEQKVMAEKYKGGNYGYGHAKKELLEKIYDFFAPYNEKREKLANNLDYIEKVRRDGAKKANDIASSKMVEIKKAIGLEIQ